jgi:hypothetical protein
MSKDNYKGWEMTEEQLDKCMDNVDMPDHLDTLETRIDEMVVLVEGLKKMTMQEEPNYKEQMELIELAVARIQEKLAIKQKNKTTPNLR